MAGSTEGLGSASATVDAVADSVPGSEETISKNARKKELKLKQKEEERRRKEELKEKAKQEASQSKKSVAVDDEEMDPTQYFENRLKYLASQKADGKNPYPHKFQVSMSLLEYIEKYGILNNGDHLEEVSESLAGRIMSKRSSSSKLLFYDLHGSGAKIQVMTDARVSELDEAEFAMFHASVKRGDIVGVTGFPGWAARIV